LYIKNIAFLSLLCLLLSPAYKGFAQLPELGISKYMVDTSTIDMTDPKPGQYIRIYTHHFLEDPGTRKARLSEAFFDTLYQIIDALPQCTFEVGMHTSSEGADTRNFNLSQRRSASIAAYLILYCNVSRERLLTMGYGETQPLNECDNNTDCPPEKRALNQRMELLICDILPASR
jgi:hypothetical protein